MIVLSFFCLFSSIDQIFNKGPKFYFLHQEHILSSPLLILQRHSFPAKFNRSVVFSTAQNQHVINVSLVLFI